MKLRINRKFCDSKKPHFPIINQGNEKETKMACTIYAPFITYDYNSNISNALGETEKDIEKYIKKTIQEQVRLGKLSLTSGGKGSDGVRAIARDYNANYIVLNKISDRNLIKDLLSKGIALTIGIRVDIDYVLDGKDGILDENWKNYIDGKNKFGHFTTIVGSNPDVVNFQKKYAIIDSYAFKSKGEWIYAFDDIDGLLDYLAMATVYLLW